MVPENFSSDFQKKIWHRIPVPHARFWQRFPRLPCCARFWNRISTWLDNGPRAEVTRNKKEGKPPHPYSSSLSSSLAAVTARSSCRPHHHCHRRRRRSLFRHCRHRRRSRRCRRCRFCYTIIIAVAIGAVVVLLPSLPLPPPPPLPPAVTITPAFAIATAVAFLVDRCLCFSAAAL